MSSFDDEIVRAKMRKLRVSTFADIFYEVVNDEAYADSHLHVSKEKVTSGVSDLSPQERIEELARMLAGLDFVSTRLRVLCLANFHRDGSMIDSATAGVNGRCPTTSLIFTLLS